MADNNPKFATFGFLTLTPGQSITVRGAEGIKALSIYVTSDSTGNCTLTGKSGFIIAGIPANSITLNTDNPGLNLSSNVENLEIDDITVSAGANCSVSISALKYQILQSYYFSTAQVISSNWLLATGYWNDNGIWDDTAKWVD